MVSPNRNCQNASFPKNTESTMPVDTVWNESLCEQTVTYHIEIGRSTPAHRKRSAPVRTMQTPVYEYASLL